MTGSQATETMTGPQSVSDLKPIEDRLVFIGGLHRSGTTPLARWLEAHPDVSGLTGTGSPVDEGQHIQSVYPAAREHGGPGLFALDPASRLTEESPLLTADAGQRLLDAWTPYWDTSKAALVEKSPPNVLMMRFMRALFPNAHFVVAVRHPIAVAVATSKWTPRLTTLDAMMRNWLGAYGNLVEDAQRVGNVTVVRYEDLMTNPPREMARIFSFLSLAPHTADWPVKEGLNDAYFERWRSANFRFPWQRWQRARIPRRYQEQVKRFGYDLVELERVSEPAPELAALMRAPASRSAG
jgi:hypothetical protein